MLGLWFLPWPVAAAHPPQLGAPLATTRTFPLLAGPEGLSTPGTHHQVLPSRTANCSPVVSLVPSRMAGARLGLVRRQSRRPYQGPSPTGFTSTASPHLQTVPKEFGCSALHGHNQ